MKNLVNSLFSPIFLAILLFLSAFFMGLATFIENDYGASFVRATIYNTWWFELILIFLTINLLGSIITRKLYTKKKLPVFLFHFSFAIMLIGSGLTRYIGYEGMMHIREGDSSSILQTQEKGLSIDITDKNGVISQTFITKEFVDLENYSKNIQPNTKLRVTKYFDNALPKIIPNPNGKAIIGIMISTKDSRFFKYIQYNESYSINNKTFAFSDKYADEDIHFSIRNDSVFIQSKKALLSSGMGENSTKNVSFEPISLNLHQIYKTGEFTLVAQEIYEEATIIAQPSATTIKGENNRAVEIEFEINNQKENMLLWENSALNSSNNTLVFTDYSITLNYGNQIINLPFSIKLDRFEIERYPGSNSPSSFSSFVTIHEPNKEARPFHIYMNNILKLNGFRFFQSSYDEDEKGTILSVNYDIWGTTVTYIGYFLLFLSIFLSLISKHTFFRNANKIIKSLVIFIALCTITPNKSLLAQSNSLPNKVVHKKHAEEFGKLLIQNPKGRTEPIFTFSSEIVRKISRSESLYGLTPVQTFIEMNLNYEEWTNVPLIKITNSELKAVLNVKTKYAAYNDFITNDGQYKLYKYVSDSYSKKPALRSKFDKAVLKADEKINICYGIFSGSYLKIFPQQDSLQTEWLAPNKAYLAAKTSEDSAFLTTIIPAYYQELIKAKTTNNYKQAEEFLAGLKKYQNHYAQYSLPTDFEVGVELHYYKWNVFKKLFPYYALVGIIYLIVLVSGIIKGTKTKPWIENSFFILIFIGFIAHTLGLAARTYISGHAPMSNGYESMIFISWVTIIAGLIFRKKLPLALSATAVLAAMTLMVANLSFMDPQITNLVPVLKSYWLTIHVSVITGSYSFLGLGAILGIINQILFISKNKGNKTRVLNAIREITVINHQTLIIGLYFLTIGTFLGAIWANESWGRYWGWDPKETWSLITIIIYTFVTHARLIPGVKGLFTFNILSLYGFSSVLMTYFGVNYYLSGMHSYAAGDPVPVPTFVYYTIAILFTLSIAAYYKNKKES